MGIYCCERSRRLHPPVLTRSRGRRSHIHGRLPLVCYILCRILVSILTGVSTPPSRRGHRKASQDSLRCSLDIVDIPGFFASVRCHHTCSLNVSEFCTL
jgi:hypothetical protein